MRRAASFLVLLLALAAPAAAQEPEFYPLLGASAEPKVALAWTNGTRQLTFWMGGGLATMVATAVLVSLFQ